jgi:hypothetical protein
MKVFSAAREAARGSRVRGRSRPHREMLSRGVKVSPDGPTGSTPGREPWYVRSNMAERGPTGARAPFRSRYLPYEELTNQVHAWAAAHPAFVRVESLGKTREGRDVWMLTIGRDPDRIRPAAWVDGNMHASELAGSSVALAIADDLIRAFADDEAPVRDLPRHVAGWLRDDVLFYVVPRMSPDGAEHVLATGAYVRSNPRDDRLGRRHAYWRAADVDGDGQARLMRREDAAGEFTKSAEHPNLLLPRRIEDEGPFYSIYPEGFIENWDGFTVPHGADYLTDNETDLNRNFPYAWAPEPHQKGAGSHPTSEPESRAVTEFVTKHPNIFAWLNLHTFGGVYIRPCGDKADKKMDGRDRSLFRQIEEWTTKITGYPMVSGFEEFTYEPDKPLCGDLSAFAYAQRGAVAFVCELWDFWARAGLTIHRPFVFNYQRRTREEIIQMAAWDRDHNRGRVVGPWRRFQHPQLGPVEIGGYDPRVGIWNPPEEVLPDVCEEQARVFLRLAGLAPRVRIESLQAEGLGGDLTRISCVVENLGYLPTYILASARPLPWNEPLRARLSLGDGLAIEAGDIEQLVGHLDGWGGYEKPTTPAFARSEHEAVRRRVSWVVRGKGRLRVQASSVRTGRVERELDVG